MTTEEKAKRYDKALESIKELYSKGSRVVVSKEEFENIFPELKESEDELTWLTRFIQEEAYSLSMDIRDYEDRVKLKKLQKALAWLEKQASKLEWSEEDEHHWMMCLECVKECATQEREDFSKTIDWLKSIKKSNGGINYDR